MSCECSISSYSTNVETSQCLQSESQHESSVLVNKISQSETGHQIKVRLGLSSLRQYSESLIKQPISYNIMNCGTIWLLKLWSYNCFNNQQGKFHPKYLNRQSL